MLLSSDAVSKPYEDLCILFELFIVVVNSQLNCDNVFKKGTCADCRSWYCWLDPGPSVEEGDDQKTIREPTDSSRNKFPLKYTSEIPPPTHEDKDGPLHFTGLWSISNRCSREMFLHV